MPAKEEKAYPTVHVKYPEAIIHTHRLLTDEPSSKSANPNIQGQEVPSKEQ